MGQTGLRPISAGELKELLDAERRCLPFVVYRDGAGRQRIETLDQSGRRLTVGRGPDNDLSLIWDERVSRVHAEFVPAGGDWLLDDDGLSTNGTWVNGERLLRRRRLEDADVVRVGATLLRFRMPALPALGPTRVDHDQPPETRISPAQRRVLVALCRPLAEGSPYVAPATNHEIAVELVITVDSVKSHMRTLFETFAVEDLPRNQKRAELASRAVSAGVVGIEELLQKR